MKNFGVLLLACILVCPVEASAGAKRAANNPLAKVFELIASLEAKIIAEGEAEEKAFTAFIEWCDDATKNVGFEIKRLTTQKSELEAKIQKLTADIADSETKIEGLVASAAADSKDLSAATAVRDKELQDFLAEEAELSDGIDTLGRAISLLQKEMAKNPAALAQLDARSLDSALKAISVIVDSATFSTHDQKKLYALVQAREKDEDNDGEYGAPAPDVYKSHGSDIVDVLEDMKDKAEEELEKLRGAETTAKNNFEMLKQSLEDSIKFTNKDLDNEKKARAAATEEKSTAEGDLVATTKSLGESGTSLETTQTDCMSTASDHEASKRGRTEELKVIAEAKKILQESTSGASQEAYSLVQASTVIEKSIQGLGSRLRTPADLAGREVVVTVQRLGKEHHNAALSQLASRISAVLKFGAAGGADPFAKVKELITAMISKLEAEAKESGTEKEYCDEQMAKTEEKKTDLEDALAKLTSQIDRASSQSAALKEDVKALQAEISAILRTQAEMDKVRTASHEVFLGAKADLQAGLDGVDKALNVLREYYSNDGSAMLQMYQPSVPTYHKKSQGAGSGIIDILEVCRSDFAKELATETLEEDNAEAEYQKVTMENRVDKKMKDQDVKYKTKEFTALDKNIADLQSDRETTASEHDAVMTYYGRIKDRCIAKAETYAEIVERRTAEIKGLKEALEILEGEVGFMQRRKRGLRGGMLK